MCVCGGGGGGGDGVFMNSCTLFCTVGLCDVYPILV